MAKALGPDKSSEVLKAAEGAYARLAKHLEVLAERAAKLIQDVRRVMLK